MKKEVIVTVKGDDNGSIDDLISFLEDAKSKGATHFSMRWSGDPNWAFKWFELYRVKTEEELKEEERQALRKRLDELTG